MHLLSPLSIGLYAVLFGTHWAEAVPHIAVTGTGTFGAIPSTGAVSFYNSTRPAQQGSQPLYLNVPLQTNGIAKTTGSGPTAPAPTKSTNTATTPKSTLITSVPSQLSGICSIATSGAQKGNLTCPMPQQTSLCPSGSTIKSIATSTTNAAGTIWFQPACATAFPMWNPNNLTCEDLNSISSDSDKWAKANGDAIVKQISSLFQKNQPFCPECFIPPYEGCPQYLVNDPENTDFTYNMSVLSQCKPGLHDASKGRWDTAAALFAEDTDVFDLNCNVGANNCNGNFACTSCTGIGTWAVLQSLGTLNDMLTNLFNVVVNAGNQAGLNQTAFSSTFAPLPSAPNPAVWQTMLTVLSGIVSGVGGTALGGDKNPLGPSEASFYGNLANGVSGALSAATPPVPADTSNILGALANATEQAYVTLANQLFTSGNATWSKGPDGSTGLDLADLMKNGNLMSTPADMTNVYQQQQPTFERALYQQLAVYTWMQLGASGKQFPYVDYKKGTCQSTPGGDDSQVDYQGDCFRLFGAKSQNPEQPTGFETAPTCILGKTLPGGTHSILDGSAWSGLIVEDFIIPSASGWLANNKKNGFTLSKTNATIADLHQPAVVSIPVCDYSQSGNAVGAGCPTSSNAAKLTACTTVPS